MKFNDFTGLPHRSFLLIQEFLTFPKICLKYGNSQ